MIIISQSPHIHGGASIDKLMWQVVLALLPALAVAVWTFGLPALATVSISVATCMLTEWVIDKAMRRRNSLTDGSAVITGLLLAFNLPSILPWWMTVIGGVVAIGIAKMSFGGLGRNIWNPALVGRVFLLLSFPAAMTTWPTDVASGADGVTGATILSALKYSPEAVSGADYLGMAAGYMNGSLGETGAIAILLGAAYLLVRGVITWVIPVCVLASAALFSWLLGGNPAVDLLSGGLMLGACFMATDYVTSPMTRSGQAIYAVMIGFITIIIRRYGAYPEGVSFAILLMNSVTPLLNRYCRPEVFGARERRKCEKARLAEERRHESGKEAAI